MRLLVVEDDRDLNRQVSAALEAAGYAVDRAFDGEEGWFRGDTEPYDAVVLDIGLPKRDGISILEAWRKAGRTMPVLILTARDRWSDKVQGIDAGADDYVAKPFHMEEVLARLRALLAPRRRPRLQRSGRRPRQARRARRARHGQQRGDQAHQPRISPACPISCTIPGASSRAARSSSICTSRISTATSNTIEVFIGRLRKKLGVDIIKTVRGLGLCGGRGGESRRR